MSRAYAASRVCLVVLLIGATATARQAPQVFRVSRSGVLVDVAVLKDKRSVDGLSLADFVVFDQGVRQTVTQVTRENLPLDVSLLIDASYSMDHGRGGGALYDARHLDAGAWTRSAVSTVIALLQPSDRLQFVTFANAAQAVRPQSDAQGRFVPPGHDAMAGRTALFDALLNVLMQPTPPDRRHVVIAVTDGLDTASAVDEVTRTLVMDRSDAVVYLVACGDRDFGFRPRTGDGGSFRVTPTDSTLNWQVPFGHYDWILEDITDRTGGRLFISNSIGDFQQRLRDSLDEFHARYLLSFEPQGVERTGWHELLVSVPTVPKATTRARKGYFAGLAP